MRPDRQFSSRAAMVAAVRSGLLLAWILGTGCSPSGEPSKEPTPTTDPREDEAHAVPAAAKHATRPVRHEAPARTAWQPRKEDRVVAHQPLEHPEKLASFYDALARIDDGEQDLVRVIHLGASMIGLDALPSVLRRKFQTRFGDGGAGLVLLKRYMSNYRHRWVHLEGSSWEHCDISYLCMGDGRYGLGGTTFWSDAGAKTTISTRKDELGDEVSRFELWYLARPGGGRIELRVDRKHREIVDTRADEMEDRYHTIDVEQGPHRIEVRHVGYGRVRAYGVLLETDGPGIVWDQFSKLGLFTKRLLACNAEHLAGQVAHRDPDLIVFSYGGNDLRRVANGKLSKAGYVDELIRVIRHVRAGKPDAACLVTSIIDKGKSLNFDITPEHVETIVEGQREAARAEGCAFFDTYNAMGGGGSLKEWARRSPPLAAKDLKHLNHRGRELLGGWIYDALIAGYVAHRAGRAPGG